ncbi:MAG: BON domain-containing protein [Pseudohongiellaceae bacterium]
MYIQSKRLLLASGITLAMATMANANAAAKMPGDDDKTMTGQETSVPMSGDAGNARQDASSPKAGEVSNADARSSMSADINNARQESRISTTFSQSPYLRDNDIEVSLKDGKATLTGTVEEDVSKDLAGQIAEGVDGIDNVDNQIKVQADYVAPKRSSTDRGFGQIVEDASITAAVKSKLAWSKHAQAMATEVETDAGKVTLSGTVDSNEAKEHANSLAMNTRGVLQVENNLKVDSSKSKSDDDAWIASDAGAESDSDQPIADTWITTKVKATFMYSSNIDSSDISVTTTNGVVTLSGKVDSGAEQSLAIALAENIRGVDSVVSSALAIDNSVAGR